MHEVYVKGGQRCPSPLPGRGAGTGAAGCATPWRATVMAPVFVPLALNYTGHFAQDCRPAKVWPAGSYLTLCGRHRQRAERALIQFYLVIWCYLVLSGESRLSSGRGRPWAGAHPRDAGSD